MKKMMIEIDNGECKRIDELRLTAFRTNKQADKDAYHAALSKWFQNLVR
jgi:hypothetical protein